MILNHNIYPARINNKVQLLLPLLGYTNRNTQTLAQCSFSSAKDANGAEQKDYTDSISKEALNKRIQRNLITSFSISLEKYVYLEGRNGSRIRFAVKDLNTSLTQILEECILDSY